MRNQEKFYRKVFDIHTKYNHINIRADGMSSMEFPLDNESTSQGGFRGTLVRFMHKYTQIIYIQDRTILGFL